jgi:hypothetical protein
MTRVYYKYAIAAVIVFDVSRPATFEAVMKVGHSSLGCLRQAGTYLL